MKVTIVELLDWTLLKLTDFFEVINAFEIVDGISILAFSVAVFIMSYLVGVLIIRG